MIAQSAGTLRIGLRMYDWEIVVRFLAWIIDFVFCKTSLSAVWFTYLPNKWVPEAASLNNRPELWTYHAPQSNARLSMGLPIAPYATWSVHYWGRLVLCVFRITQRMANFGLTDCALKMTGHEFIDLVFMISITNMFWQVSPNTVWFFRY